MQHIVIDTDCGNDDLLAIGTLYLSQQYHIHLVTNIHGMEKVPVAHHILTKVFEELPDNTRPIVLPGYAVSNLVERSIMNESWGDDYKKEYDDVMRGLALPTVEATPSEYDFNDPDMTKIARELQRIGSQYQSFVYLCLGPLTNIEYLLQHHSDLFKQHVSKVVIMGGAYKVPGNTDDGECETNFYLDPVAAKYVLDHCPVPIELFGLEVANVPNGERLDIAIDEKYKLQSPIASRVEKLIELQPLAKSYDTVVSYYLTHPDEVVFEDVHFTVNPVTGRCIPDDNSTTRMKLAIELKGDSSKLPWYFSC